MLLSHSLTFFRKHPEAKWSELRWAIGSALRVIANESISAELLEIASDDKYGSSRQMVVLSLCKLKKSYPIEFLATLLDDPCVAAHALSAIVKLGGPKAKAVLERKATETAGKSRDEILGAIAKLRVLQPPG